MLIRQNPHARFFKLSFIIPAIDCNNVRSLYMFISSINTHNYKIKRNENKVKDECGNDKSYK